MTSRNKILCDIHKWSLTTISIRATYAYLQLNPASDKATEERRLHTHKCPPFSRALDHLTHFPVSSLLRHKGLISKHGERMYLASVSTHLPRRFNPCRGYSIDQTILMRTGNWGWRRALTSGGVLLYSIFYSSAEFRTRLLQCLITTAISKEIGVSIVSILEAIIMLNIRDYLRWHGCRDSASAKAPQAEFTKSSILCHNARLLRFQYRCQW